MSNGKKTQNWRRRSFQGMRDVVASMTRESLKKRGSSAKPGSKEYEAEFNRLVQVYYANKQAEAARRNQKDAEWLEIHRNDSDEELLAYVRSAVKEKEQFSKPSRVPGGGYIAQRFGNWQVAIHFAGLEPPKGYGTAAPEAIEAYLSKKREAESNSVPPVDR